MDCGLPTLPQFTSRAEARAEGVIGGTESTGWVTFPLVVGQLCRACWTDLGAEFPSRALPGNQRPANW